MIPPRPDLEEDGAVDAELARLNDWWSAELAAVVAGGMDAEKAARSMLVSGAIALSAEIGPDAASVLLSGLAASFRSVGRR